MPRLPGLASALCAFVLSVHNVGAAIIRPASLGVLNAGTSPTHLPASEILPSTTCGCTTIYLESSMHTFSEGASDAGETSVALSSPSWSDSTTTDTHPWHMLKTGSTYTYPMCSPSTKTQLKMYTPCDIDSTSGWCATTVSYSTTVTEYANGTTDCPGPVATETLSWFSQPKPTSTPVSRAIYGLEYSEVVQSQFDILTRARDADESKFRHATQGYSPTLTADADKEDLKLATISRNSVVYPTLAVRRDADLTWSPIAINEDPEAHNGLTTFFSVTGPMTIEVISMEYGVPQITRTATGLLASALQTWGSLEQLLTMSPAQRHAHEMAATAAILDSESGALATPTNSPSVIEHLGQDSVGQGRSEVDLVSSVSEPMVAVQTVTIYSSLTTPALPTPSKTMIRVVHASEEATYTATKTVEAIRPANPTEDAPVDPRKTFRIVARAYYGDFRFDNLTIQNPISPYAASVPLLAQNVTNAAKFYFDRSTSSLALCCSKSNTTSGIVMVRDRDNDAYGTVLLGKEVGTARISWACCDDGPPNPNSNPANQNEPIVWENDRFGSWLVCQRPVSGVYELRWWDVVTNRGIDQGACAKVDLIGVNFGSEAHEDC